ncbi:hypothetical protein PtA15_2A297 [Puccinia triticina]|uniref:Uncharacterized protein n=1 Tax=Puccinia triticina TaxID=208348 RepID=A0ABY7CBC8_9BASI|nr:uncharacterized protein PtA15_2A297 [Puccinia triticina]WAQ81984.1 hypothetical protein PtA15_2A297 [Puccinia triticina]
MSVTADAEKEEWPDPKKLLVLGLKKHLKSRGIPFDSKACHSKLVQIYKDNRPLSLRGNPSTTTKGRGKRLFVPDQAQDNPPAQTTKRPRRGQLASSQAESPADPPPRGKRVIKQPTHPTEPQAEVVSKSNAQPGTSTNGLLESHNAPSCPKQQAESSLPHADVPEVLPQPDPIPPVVSKTNTVLGKIINGQPDIHQRTESSLISNGLPWSNHISPMILQTNAQPGTSATGQPEPKSTPPCPKQRAESSANETPQLDPAYPLKRPRSYPTPMLDPIRRRPVWIVERHLATLGPTLASAECHSKGQCFPAAACRPRGCQQARSTPTRLKHGRSELSGPTAAAANVTPSGDASPQLPASLETANKSAQHQQDHNTANQSLQDPPLLPPSATPRGNASQQLPAGPEAFNKPAQHPPDYNTANQSLADPPPLPLSATPRGNASQQLPAGPEAVNKPARHPPDYNTANQSLADPPPLPPSATPRGVASQQLPAGPEAVNKPAQHQPDHKTANQSLADPPPLPPSATLRSNAFQQLPAGPEAVNKPAQHQLDYNTGDQSLLDPPPLPPSVAPSGDAFQELPASLEAANKPADHHQADCNIANQNLPDPLLQVLPSCDIGIPSSHLGKHPPTASTESPCEEDLHRRRKRLKERQWHTDPKKLTIAKIKEVLTEFAIKPRSSDKKENYVKHYKTLAKQQEGVWAKYLEEKELWAKHLGPSCKRHQANKETQKTPQLDQEIPVNVPVTQSKTAKDSVEPVLEIPDLMNLSPAVNPPCHLPSHKQPEPSTAQQFKTLFPTQRLIQWAATVDDAMHQMDVDDPPIHTNEPNDPAVPGNLLDIPKSLLQSMQTIATGVSSLQATPASDPTHLGAASRLRPSSRAVPSDQEEEIHETPSARPRGRRATPRPAPSGPIPQGGPIPDAIGQHCATLLGRGLQDLLPPPATAAERRSWIYTLEPQSNGHASDTNSNSSVTRDSSGENDSAGEDGEEDHMELDVEYQSGWPRNPKASQETLQIMQCMMRQAGVQSFRPDLGSPTSTAANTFLWDLAVWIFMTLVDAGKYKDVTRETCSEELAATMIHNHATNSIGNKIR